MMYHSLAIHRKKTEPPKFPRLEEPWATCSRDYNYSRTDLADVAFLAVRFCWRQGQILHIHWSQHVTNAEISARTGLPPVIDFIRRRRLSVFDHISRLTQGTPAHNALHCQVGLASGRSLGRDWRRRPGRPRARWTDQLRNDTGSVPANLWRQTGNPTGATRRPELATRWRRRRRPFCWDIPYTSCMRSTIGLLNDSYVTSSLLYPSICYTVRAH